jgi:molecular chaperone DnaK (HSP70)
VRLGVDFGTTHTVVARVEHGNYPVLHFHDQAGDSHEFFPSVVAEAEGELHFGFEALALAAERGTLVRSFKRWLSDPDALPSTPARVGNVVLPLGQLIEQYLAAVHGAILEHSDFRSERELQGARTTAFESVVAVPAHANGAQRFATLDAFRRAGFAPLAMLNEPSAAGFEFTHRHRDTLNSRREHVVVYDLGGGTFDASLVCMRGRQHEILASAGLGRLGGDDFDEVLLELVLAQTKLTHSQLTAAELDRVREHCREAKERLSPSSRKLSIDLESALGRPDLTGVADVTIAVSDFYDACQPLIERSIECMLPVMTRLEGALDAEGSVPGGIAGVYVVGGASSLPLVARILRKRFGRRVYRSPYPSAAVAIGLAIACDEAAGFELTDHYARTFGVFREGAAGHQITFDPIFTQATRVPINGHAVTCSRVYRAAHNIGHFRFLECAALDDDGRPGGDIVLSGDVLFPFDPALRESSLDLSAVPVQRTHNGGPRIEEHYTLDEHGTIAVTIRNLDADYQRVYRLGA